MAGGDQILIDKFLRDELSAEELILFNEKKKDPEFSKLLYEMERVIDGLKRKEVDSMINLISELEHKENQSSKSLFSNWYIIIIVFFIFTLLVLWIIGRSEPKPSNNQLFADYFEPFPNVIDPIRKSNDSNELTIFQNYEYGNYEKVIAEFDSNTTNADSLFYGAISYVMLNRVDAAESIFERLKITQNSYNDQIEWYLALLCVKNAEKDCTQLLTFIGDSNGPYRNKAIEILDKLQ